MLQYRSVKASEALAKEATLSARRMEGVTNAMYAIAEKTKEETSSMKVITSVSVTLTLFFLPATFTAVSGSRKCTYVPANMVKTFMSTSILNYDRGTRDFQLDGLKLFLAIALPMTVLTFMVWYAIYRWAKRKELLAVRKLEIGP